jgi:hypothetical protein
MDYVARFTVHTRVKSSEFWFDTHLLHLTLPHFQKETISLCVRQLVLLHIAKESSDRLENA